MGRQKRGEAQFRGNLWPILGRIRGEGIQTTGPMINSGTLCLYKEP